MNRQERALRKELLLLKGEALRMRLMLEMSQWRRPLHLAAEGAELWKELPRLKALLGVAAVLIPNTRLRGMLKWASQAALVFKLLSSAFRKA